jgi:hypothetical protein
MKQKCKRENLKCFYWSVYADEMIVLKFDHSCCRLDLFALEREKLLTIIIVSLLKYSE